MASQVLGLHSERSGVTLASLKADGLGVVFQGHEVNLRALGVPVGVPGTPISR